MEKSILVTGGAGYIGAFTVSKLIDFGYKVVVLDSLEAGHREAVDQRAMLEIANLQDKTAIARIFDKYDIEAVIDFAAYLAVGESMKQPEKYFYNNIVNFINLLDIMRERGCNYIIKSSTAAVYGNPEKESDFPLKEEYTEKYLPKESALLDGLWKEERVIGDDFLDRFINFHNNFYKSRKELLILNEDSVKLKIPTSIYGLSKLLDEIILRKYNLLSGINFSALRYFNVCGAEEDSSRGEDKPNPTTLMTLVIYSLLGKRPLKIFGNDYPTPDGTGVRDYIHPLDLAEGHILALKNLIKTGKSEVYNLGCGKGYSVLEVIKAIEKASGKKVKYEICPRRSGDPAISYADPNKANDILGWHAKHDLESMARTAWLWHSTHPNGY